MASDIDKLNAALADAQKAQEVQRQKQQEEHARAVETVAKMIELYNIKPEELGFLPVATVNGNRISKNGTLDTRHNVQPKYRGPNGETWAGRGRTPLWMEEAVTAGAHKDDFLIEKQERANATLHRQESEIAA